MSQPTQPHVVHSPKRSSADPTDPRAPHQPGELAPARAPGPGVEPIEDADVIESEDIEQAPETD